MLFSFLLPEINSTRSVFQPWTHTRTLPNSHHLSLLHPVWTTCNTSSTFPPFSYLYNLQNHDQSTRSWKPPNYSRPWPSLHLESLKTLIAHCLAGPMHTGYLYFDFRVILQVLLCRWFSSIFLYLLNCICLGLFITQYPASAVSHHGQFSRTLPTSYPLTVLAPRNPSLRKEKETQWVKDHGIQWSCINPHGVRTNHLKEWQDPQTHQLSEHFWADHGCGDGG